VCGCSAPRGYRKDKSVNIIGLDLGGTKCTVVTGADKGDPRQIARFPTKRPAETLEKIFAVVEEIPVGDNPIFGISAGDPMDAKKGLLLGPPNMPGWDNVEIVREITDRFGGEAYLMNDANAGALAEWRFGAAKGYSNIVFCTHGTGMGAGLILDGRLYEGTNGSAGEIGHTRLSPDGPVGYGKRGSFEGWCSGGGIARLAKDKAKEQGGKVAFNPGKIEDITTKDVAEAAEKGDELAREILATSGRYLGRGLAMIIDILNPEIIVLGSLYLRCGKFLEKAMRDELKKEALPQSLKNCKIAPAALGEQIGNYAAICVALYRMGLMH